MGSCYSKAEGSGLAKSTATAAATAACASPLKQKQKQKQKQRQGSGRWRKKADWSRSMDEADLRNIAGTGRMFINGATKSACLYTQQGKKGTNQDAMLVWENFSSRNDTVFCGVFDGHGPYGHLVTNKVRDSLSLILCTQWNGFSTGDEINLCKTTVSEDAASLSMDDECSELLDTEENEQFPDLYWQGQLKQSILKASKLMDKELKLHPTIDCLCSGSTAVISIKQVNPTANAREMVKTPSKR